MPTNDRFFYYHMTRPMVLCEGLEVKVNTTIHAHDLSMNTKTGQKVA